MSPSIEALQTVANDISVGFETLLAQVDDHREFEHQLRHQLATPVKRVGKLPTVSTQFV